MNTLTALTATVIIGAVGIPIVTRLVRRFGVAMVSGSVVVATVAFLLLNARFSGGKMEAAQALLAGGMLAYSYGVFVVTAETASLPMRLFTLLTLAAVFSAVSLTGLDSPAVERSPGAQPTSTTATTAAPDPPVAADPTMFSIDPIVEPGVLAAPTTFVFGPNEELYVGTSAGIKRLSDLDGDGFFESVEHYALEGAWILGLAFRDDSLYAAQAGQLLRLRGETPDVEVLVDGLPWNRYRNHSNNGIVFGPDGTLFMTLGGTSDHGPELEDAGLILAWDEATGEVSTYATGFRNPYDIGYCPDGNLYATDNGPDQFDDTLLYRPPDEINLIVSGSDYGYPDFFGNAPAWSNTESPIALLPASGAATGFICHSGTGLPSEYRGNIFVALWGTATQNPEAGRRLMRIELDLVAGRPFGVAQNFAGGFGHPIDLLEDRDGSMLVLDYGQGTIFRVSYVGP